MTISSFSGEYRWLSNFWAASVSLEGLKYPTAEHAYQAFKSVHDYDRQTILMCKTPAMAKSMGRTLLIRNNWEGMKYSVMERVIAAKFNQNDYLRRLLIGTGSEELIEGNHWNDTFWGVCNGKGHNHLGKIIMAYRDRLFFSEFEIPLEPKAK